MLTPSPAEGYSLSISSEGLKITHFCRNLKVFSQKLCRNIKMLTPEEQLRIQKVPAPWRRRALELKITITFLLCNKYPHEYKKQKLPVSDTELIVSCFGTEGLNSTVAARLRGISAS